MAKVKELEKNKVEIEFEISQEAVTEAERQAYQKTKGKYAIPGFRKGKAPKHMIEQFYGKGIFFEDAFEIAFPDAYSKAVEELDLFVVSSPENVDIVAFEPVLTVKAEAYTKPDVTLGAYTGLEIEYESNDVTEEDVNKKLESLRNQNASFVTVDRPAENGDKVIIDYSGSVDGEKFEGGTAEEQTLDLGSGAFIPGFEEQVVGMSAGEEKVIDVTFPESYGKEELAGKAAQFEIKLHEAKVKQLPELDDEFAQDVSEFDTLAEYTESIKKELSEQNEKQAAVAKENALVERIVDNAEVDIPACMIDRQVNYQINDMAQSMMYQGIDFNDYLRYIGATIEDIKAHYRTGAEKQVKAQLTMEAVLKAEDVKADDEDVKKSLAERAEKEEKTVEELMEGISEQEMEYIKDRVTTEKLIAMLLEKNTMLPVSGAELANKAAEAKEAEKEETPKED